MEVAWRQPCTRCGQLVPFSRPSRLVGVLGGDLRVRRFLALLRLAGDRVALVLCGSNVALEDIESWRQQFGL